jgi:GDP-4-dehydro-6-deoxy-D-mannose reductase
MSKILVTGVNGFVGQHLAKELSDNGYEVIGVGGAQGATEKSPYVAEYQVLDLTNRDEAAKIDFSDIAGVIHLAGMAAVGPSFDDPMLYMNVNVGIEVNLFEAAMKQGAKPRFIIISSGTLYDPKADLPLTEESPVLPNSPYAVSKFGQEQMGLYYETRGFETIIARPFNHIGPGQGPGFIVPDLTQQVVAIEKGAVNELLVGNLDAQRDYTDVRDIARAYRLLFEQGRSGHTYNICSGKALSGHDVLKGILASTEINPEAKQDPDKMRPSDNPVIYGSFEKIAQDTGWAPEIKIETTLADVVSDWRNKAQLRAG